MKTNEELRNGTKSNFVIFFDEKEVKTTQSGAINSNGGLVLEAFISELNCYIQHRSNDNYGRKGFTLSSIPQKALSSEIRNRLNYKY